MGGEKSLICDPGSELRLGGRGNRRAKIINGTEKKEESYITIRVPCIFFPHLQPYRTILNRKNYFFRRVLPHRYLKFRPGLVELSKVTQRKEEYIPEHT